jgi:calcineurin-like phosphoesterase family protein
MIEIENLINMSVFFTSDLHFSHRNLIKDLRGFESIDEHDEMLVENWNKTVHSHDKVFILGDFSMDSPDVIEKFIPRLNGLKDIVLCNHDTPRCAKKFVELGCKVSSSIKYKDFLLTHIPVHQSQLFINGKRQYLGNIHGHIHLQGVLDGEEYNPQIPEELSELYFNVNCEFHNYKPISLDYVKELFQ